MRLTRRVTVMVTLALLAACGTGAEPGASQRGAAPTATVDPAASPATEGVGSPAAVHGEIAAVSDVAGEGETPVRDGHVLAVAEAQADEFWAATDREPPPEHQLPYWNPSVPASAVEDIGGVIAPIHDGRFELDMAPGDSLFCLARGDDPLHLNGCSRVTLAGADRLRGTVGEGGFELGPAD